MVLPQTEIIDVLSLHHCTIAPLPVGTPLLGCFSPSLKLSGMARSLLNSLVCICLSLYCGARHGQVLVNLGGVKQGSFSEYVMSHP